MKYKAGMKLIDAHKLREKIESFTGKFVPGGGFEVSLDAVLHAIDYSHGVDAEPVKRWIDVNDDIPEDTSQVLVICKGDYMLARCGHSRKHGLRWYVTDGVMTTEIEEGDVTHWMPLPKKPRKNKE
jgi:hypothetical protein